ncbi:MAG: hypothetical protein K5746_05420 [Clostridiales bacterium]|nr:hypothetical protein [Clostridiales bacterium]
MQKSSSLPKTLLLLGMAFVLPTYLFTVGNVLLCPWPLYARSRALLLALTPCCFLLLLALNRLSGPLSRLLERREKTVLILFAAVFFFIQFFLALSLRHIPITDPEQCVTAAEKLADTGRFADSERSYIYFSRYPFNLGYVYFLSFLYRFFSFFGLADRYAQTALAACLLFSCGAVSCARLIRRLSGPRAEAHLLFLILLTLPFWTAAAEGYTDVFAVSFAPMILLSFLRSREEKTRKGRVFFATIFALFSFFGMQMRITVLIVSIACLLQALFEGHIRSFFLLLACLFAVCLPGHVLVEQENARHLGAENLRQHRLSVWHYLAMGLPVHEDEGYGQYGYGGWLIFSTSFEDPQERNAALKSEIKDRVYSLRYPSRLLNMLSRKNLSTFGDGSFQLNELIEGDAHEPDNPVKQVLFYRGRLRFAYQHICTALFLSQMLLACLSCLMALKNRETAGASLFLTLVGAFLYLSCWETRARYFFMFQFVLLAAGALYFAPGCSGVRQTTRKEG